MIFLIIRNRNTISFGNYMRIKYEIVYLLNYIILRNDAYSVLV